LFSYSRSFHRRSHSFSLKRSSLHTRYLPHHRVP